MKINKSQRSNLILFIILALILFTPFIGIMHEFTSKIFSFSPSIEKEDKRVQLATYDWQLKGLNTQNLDFNSVKGKVVFVNFWATWCPPCRAELPSIQQLNDTYKNKVEFIFVTNENEITVNKFLTKNNYNLPVYNNLSRPPIQMSVSTIPASFLIDKNGKNSYSQSWSCKLE